MISVISYRRPIAIGALLTTCTACILTMIQIPIDVQENNVVLPPNNLNCSAQGMYKNRVVNEKIKFKNSYHGSGYMHRLYLSCCALMKK